MCGNDCIPAFDGTDLAVGITDKRGDSRRDIGGYSRCAGLYVAKVDAGVSECPSDGTTACSEWAVPRNSDVSVVPNSERR